MRAYSGTRIIYIGDGHGGAAGDDQMHALLETDWAEVDSRQPVLWWGQHDKVTVYDATSLNGRRLAHDAAPHGRRSANFGVNNITDTKKRRSATRNA